MTERRLVEGNAVAFGHQHVIEIAVVIVVVVFAALSLIRGLVWRSESASVSEDRHIDDFFLLGLIADFGFFAGASQTGNLEFVKYLTGKVPGEWTVVWDGNNIRSKSKVVKAWLAKHPNVVEEDFPAYDPQNNPDGWVWSWAKCGKLSNFCPADVEWLFNAVMDALEELKLQPTLLASFVMDAGVPLCL